jgi:hypothetical protein
MARTPGSLAARPLRRAAAMIAGVAALTAVAGCAMSTPADLTPGVDPGLPSMSATNDPSPGARSDAGASQADAASPSGSDGGLKGLAHDAGPDAAQAAPPPPPPPTAPKPAIGEVLITEVMYAPLTPEPTTEWFELHSLASSDRALTGLTIKDGSGRMQTIAANVVLAPGAYVVLARTTAGAISAKVPAGVIAYEYGAGLSNTAGVLLTNGATGGLALLDGSVTLASAPYGGWFSQPGGHSVQLKVLDASAAAAKASWCLSASTWAAGSDLGTPGAPGDCP